MMYQKIILVLTLNFNEVTIYYKDSKKKKEKLSYKTKSEISEEIVDRIITQIN